MEVAEDEEGLCIHLNRFWLIEYAPLQHNGRWPSLFRTSTTVSSAMGCQTFSPGVAAT